MWRHVLPLLLVLASSCHWRIVQADEDEGEAMTESQLRALAILPKVSSPLSAMGSLFVMYDILKSREKLKHTYSRIMLVLSCFDFLSSIGLFPSTWPMPVDTPGVYNPQGTTETCIAQGFFVQLGLGAALYNGSLSFYYLVVIAFNFTNERVRRIEWILHALPLSLALAFAIAPIPLNLYNGSGFWCWISSLPVTCENGNLGPDQGVGPCERGQNAWIYRWAFWYGPFFTCFAMVLVNVSAVVFLVWRKQRASKRFQFGHAETKSTWVETIRDIFTCGCTQQSSRRRSTLASQVGWQAAFYVVAFFIPWLPSTIFRLQQDDGEPVSFSITAAITFLYPLQGFFNMAIYIRPRVLKYRREHPERTLIGATSAAVNRTLRLWRDHHRPSSSSTLEGDTDANHHDDEMEDVMVMDPSYAFSSAIVTEQEDPAHVLELHNEALQQQQQQEGESKGMGNEAPPNGDKQCLQQQRVETALPDDAFNVAVEDQSNPHSTSDDNSQQGNGQVGESLISDAEGIVEAPMVEEIHVGDAVVEKDTMIESNHSLVSG